MKRTNLILIVFLFLLLFFGGLVAFFNNKSRVNIVDLVPAPGQDNVNLGSLIKVSFDKNPETVEYKIEPETPSEKTIEGNLLIIRPRSQLSFNTVYNIYLFSKQKQFYSWYFKTRMQTEEDMVKEETDLTEEYYPLYKLVPYKGEGFRANYIGKLHLRVEYKGEQDVVKEKVFEWVESNNVDPTSHRYEWVEEKVL